MNEYPTPEQDEAFRKIVETTVVPNLKKAIDEIMEPLYRDILTTCSDDTFFNARQQARSYVDAFLGDQPWLPKHEAWLSGYDAQHIRKAMLEKHPEFFQQHVILDLQKQVKQLEEEVDHLREIQQTRY